MAERITAADLLTDGEPGRIAVVGGGIAGVAAAAAASAAGCSVDLIDRGYRLGGRLALSTLRDTGTSYDGHAVDVGASYFTATDPDFSALVHDWCARGLARPWTDSFHVADPGGIVGVKAGPIRYAASGGLRSLVEDLAHSLPESVRLLHPADVVRVHAGEAGECPRLDLRVGEDPTLHSVAYDAVALCAPDPQLARLLAPAHASVLLHGAPEWEPVMALVAVYDRRLWPELDGVFVNDDAVLTWIADDGRRRGTGAPVLVAHSTAPVAAAHLAEPAGAGPVLVDALTRVLDLPCAPQWSRVKRWTFAKPLAARGEAFRWDDRLGLGVAGDSWGGAPRTESAWLSGHGLGRAIAGVRG